MPDDPMLFTCELCGRQFEPTPDAMIEWENGLVQTDADGIELQDLATAGAEELEDIGLTPDQRDAVLRGEVVKTGGCVCLQCQDEMNSDDQDTCIPAP